MNNLISDTLNRPLHDLRVSVIDRCNFRCSYCMPADETKDYQFLKQNEWLSFDEIHRLVKVFVRLGVKKVRLTGGEPLLRPNLSDLIRTLAAIKEIDDLALTTNGSLLKRYAPDLKQAGLKRLTLSLDTLDARVFQMMSGGRGSLAKVMEGLKAAEANGFDSIKINVVIQKGVNDNSILQMAEYFRGTGHVLRFIEFMDVGNCNHWQSKYVLPSKEVAELINRKFPIEALDANYYGEVASRYRYKDGQGEIGFVSSVSQPFCQSCTRARLSADGKIITCLFAQDGTDIRTPLRQGASDEELISLIQSVWQKREDRYSELRSEKIKSLIPSKKVEMFQVGG